MTLQRRIDELRGATAMFEIQLDSHKADIDRMEKRFKEHEYRLKK